MNAVFGLQDEVSHQIAGALEIRLTSTEKEMIARVPTSDLKAYDAYLRGRELLKQRDPAGVRNALAMFQQARTLDPNFAQAFAGLADAHAVALMYGWDLGEDARSAAAAASRQAILLDPTLAEAHLSRGVVAALEGDMEGGQSRVLHAISLDPKSAAAHHWLSLLLKLQGRYDDAAREDLQALALDPALVPARLNLAHIAILEGKPDDAVAGMGAVLKFTDEPLARALMAWALMRKGEGAKALEQLDAAVASHPDDALVAGMRGMALAATGNRAAALSEAKRASDLSDVKPYPPADYAVACVHAVFGEREEAFRYLGRALRTKALTLSAIISPRYIQDDPALASLRGDPRFAVLVKAY
jgi:Flp pilus assembly protein TadD